jgi:hypothetical protein
VKESAGGAKNGFFFDPFDDAESVVRVDDLVADLECHVSPAAAIVGGRTGVVPGTAPMSIAQRKRPDQREMAENWRFCAL